jgi:hypothetical protein
MYKILTAAVTIIILGVTVTGTAHARGPDNHHCRAWAQDQTQAQPHYTWRYYGGPKSGPLWPSVEPQQGVYRLACDMPDSNCSNGYHIND